VGYYERKAGVTLLQWVLIVGVVGLVIAWPWILGTQLALSSGAEKNGATYDLAGWIPEGLWIVAVVYGVWRYVTRVRAAQAAALTAHAEHLQKVTAYRAMMAKTNDVWFDAEAGHYRHSTCTIKHRSEGPAGRCSSRI
jgi:hypothetical protein